jgi:protein-S-isoprenylcysteine O-methyltransferase Ste14
MNTTRYVLGVLLIVGLPPAIVFWLLIHPLADLWRRVGPAVTYVLVGLVSLGTGVVVYRFRGPVMGTDLGTNGVLIFSGVLLYLVSAWISVLTRRDLALRTFVGMPEILGDDSPGTLLRNGMYGRVRHPRYLSVILGTVGFAMFVNYLGPYLMVLGSIFALIFLINAEDRELSQRFGSEYDRYRSRVPGLIPRFRRPSEGARDRS